MKNSIMALIGLALIFTVNLSYGQFSIDKSKLVMQDNEIQRNQAGQDANFFCNPITLNGQVLDYSNFNIRSQGQLSVVTGDPKSPGASKVPFYIALRRNGKIIKETKMGFLNQQIYSIDIAKVLSFSKPGDELIITPANKTDWKAKRILKIIS